MKRYFTIALAATVGVLAGASGVWLLTGEGETTGSGEPEPLYWVAPMDPDYRRDKPGKSPMGMDLIAVYKETRGKDAPGTVRISPDVVNNLGVRTATVERGRLAPTINTVGYVRYDEDGLIHIHPRVEGWIETLHVESSGDPIEAAEPLYTLYSPTLVGAQEELQLALKRDNPDLIRAAVARLQALQVPAASIEQVRGTGRVSQTVTQYAPQSGVVDDLQVREGMYVKPGMNIMSIGRLDHIWVIGQVFERRLQRLAAHVVKIEVDALRD